MAKIDLTKIEGYEKMTVEEKLKALEAFEYDDGASEIERYKNAASKSNSDAAEWKRKHNALLSDEEKKKQEIEEYVKSVEHERDELRREKTISEHTAKFIGLGYNEALAADTAVAMADGDLSKVFANQKAFIEEHDKAMKVEAMKKMPTPPAGAGGKALTKEEIMAIRDPAKRQAAIAENIELFKRKD